MPVKKHKNSVEQEVAEQVQEEAVVARLVPAQLYQDMVNKLANYPYKEVGDLVNAARQLAKGVTQAQVEMLGD